MVKAIMTREEYKRYCDEKDLIRAKKISALVKAGKMKTYTLEEIEAR